MSNAHRNRGQQHLCAHVCVCVCGQCEKSGGDLGHILDNFYINQQVSKSPNKMLMQKYTWPKEESTSQNASNTFQVIHVALHTWTRKRTHTAIANSQLSCMLTNFDDEQATRSIVLSANRKRQTGERGDGIG